MEKSVAFGNSEIVLCCLILLTCNQVVCLFTLGLSMNWWPDGVFSLDTLLPNVADFDVNISFRGCKSLF